MSLTVLLSGLVAVMGGFVLHMTWWRLSRPKDDLLAVTICMLLVPAVMVLGYGLYQEMPLQEIVLSLILAASCGAAYVFWYPAAQAASPTMLITILAAQAGPDGISEEALKDSLSDERLSGNSLESLVGERFAHEDEAGNLHLAPRGRRTLSVIRMLRRSAGFDDPKG